MTDLCRLLNICRVVHILLYTVHIELVEFLIEGMDEESADGFEARSGGQRIEFYYFEIPNSRGKSVQDRILALDDIWVHVCNPKTRLDSPYADYILAHPGLQDLDWNSLTDRLSDSHENPLPILKLFGIFDGHGGQFASSFAVSNIAFELVAQPKFRDGSDFPSAVRAAILSLHENMKSYPGFRWEPRESWCSSGTTVSLALVTSEKTYFAFLGDSPIYVIPRTDTSSNARGNAYPLFKAHSSMNESNVSRLKESRSPVGRYEGYFNIKFRIILSGEADKHQLWEKVDRISLAGLNCWGTIGDVIADPCIFNVLLGEIHEFKQVVKSRKHPLVRKNKYKHFVRFLRDRPSFPLLQQHIVLLENSQAAPFPIRTLLESRYSQDKLLTSPIQREPDISVLDNSSMFAFFVASDGVSSSNHGPFLDETISQHNTRIDCARHLKLFWTMGNGDDRTALLVWLDK